MHDQSGRGMYDRCDETNTCVCAKGTVASPLDGHYDAHGNPVCVGVWPTAVVPYLYRVLTSMLE
jgi:hypothetical protein